MPPLIFCKSCTVEGCSSYLIYPNRKKYVILRYDNTGVMPRYRNMILDYETNPLSIAYTVSHRPTLCLR